MQLSQLIQNEVEFDKKPPFLPAFAFLVIADPGSLDRLDVVQASAVPELRISHIRVSKSSSFAASALSDIA